MLDLHQFPRNPHTINFSPFCLKAEAYLRFAGVPFQHRATPDPRKSPSGKLPYVVDGGRAIPDSHAIIAHVAKGSGKDLDAGLTEAQRAEAHVLRRALEDGLLYVILYARWVDDGNWPKTRDAFFHGMPGPLKALITPGIRRRMVRRVRAQGTGLLPADAVYRMGIADLDALAARLGQGPYLFGDKPTSADAVAFGFLNNVIHDVVDSPMHAHARGLKALGDYCARIRAAWFADLRKA